MAQTLTTIARPYAKAAFEFACEKRAQKKWLTMLQESALIVENADMQALLLNPKATTEQTLTIFFDLIKVDEYEKNFLSLLGEYKRLIVLPQITKTFALLLAEHEKVLPVQIISAFDLTQKQKSEFQSALKKRLKSEVELQCETDKSILGGAIIRAGSLVIDGSAKAYLADLYKTLKGKVTCS